MHFPSSLWGALLASASLALVAAAPLPLLNLNADSQFAPARACLLPADIARRQKDARAGRKPIKLSQKDFNTGPYVIDKPGRYVLSEDVEFMPSSVKAVRAGAPQPPPALGRCMRAGGAAVKLVRLSKKRKAVTEAQCLGLCLKKGRWLGGCQFLPARGVCHGAKASGWWSSAVAAHHGDGSTAVKCWTAAALRDIIKATSLPPTAAAFLFPTPQQLEENTAYALGFFAAIIITADDVVIDLGGHTLAQSRAHALVQRFFSLIELADSPFPADKGPAHFSSAVTSSNYVTIMNGRLGRSSHHAIHGNSNSHVTVKDLEITDFEVSGVHLNKASCLRIGGARKATRSDQVATNCDGAEGSGGIVKDTKGTCFNVRVHSTRRDVAVNGQFSAALNLVRFAYSQLGAHAADPRAATPAALRRLAASDLPALEAAVVATINQVLRGVAVATMFASDTRGLPDGSLVAGIVVHPDLNVGGYWDAPVEDTALSVHVENVGVANLAVNPAEILALKTIPKPAAATASPQGKAAHDKAVKTTIKFDKHLSFASIKVLDTFNVAQHVHDLFGSVFDVGAVLDRKTFVYSGDAFSDMQVALASYKAECTALSTGGTSCPNIEMLDRHNLDASIVAWASATDTRKAQDAWGAVQATHTVQDGHDFMHHMNKGAVAIKVDGVAASSFQAVAVDVVENHAGTGRRPAAIPCVAVGNPGCTSSGGNMGYKAAAPYRGWDAHAVTLATVNGFTGRSYEASTGICSVESQHFAEHSVINPTTSLRVDVDKAWWASTTTQPVYHGLLSAVKPLPRPLPRPRRGSDDELA